MPQNQFIYLPFANLDALHTKCVFPLVMNDSNATITYATPCINALQNGIQIQGLEVMKRFLFSMQQYFKHIIIFNGRTLSKYNINCTASLLDKPNGIFFNFFFIFLHLPFWYQHAIHIEDTERNCGLNYFSPQITTKHWT